MTKRHERSLARRMAVQLLYMSAQTQTPVEDLVASGVQLPDEGVLPEYACLLAKGCSERSAEIDEKLAGASKNWSVERMPLVDLAILRIATYEMLYSGEVPVSVCINEAVELAKEFGGHDESARFANGLLGQIARTYCGDAAGNLAEGAAQDYDGGFAQGFAEGVAGDEEGAGN